MCGRTACTLAACDLRRACSYPHNGKYRQPECHDNGQVYKPSHNFCPTDTSLVLVAGSHMKKSEPRVLVPMIWGMIPPWHKGDSWKNHGLTTHNCRLEGISSSRLYGKALRQGRRCVIVCNGFYEWQTTKGKANKVPYLIYDKQPEGVDVVDEGPWSWSEEDGWSGPSLLYIAGLFDMWRSPQGKELHSYTMITLESDEALSWLHHRQPAFLRSDEQVSAWLDRGPVESLRPSGPTADLMWHRVSMLVNGAHNKDPACARPLAPSSEKKPCKSSLMSAWLQRGSPRGPDGGDAKRVKLEADNDSVQRPGDREGADRIKVEPEDAL